MSDDGRSLIDDHLLALTGTERPRVCFVPTASGGGSTANLLAVWRDGVLVGAVGEATGHPALHERLLSYRSAYFRYTLVMW